MNKKEYTYISSWIDKNSKKLSNWNQIIWNLAEPAWREYESSKLYIEILKKLRSENISSEIYPGEGKIKKQMEYANKINSPCVIFCGEEVIKKSELLTAQSFRIFLIF